MDTSVIHWFVETCDATGHPVMLRNVTPAVRRVLDIVGDLGMDGDAWVIS
jgi:hypothetical protein